MRTYLFVFFAAALMSCEKKTQDKRADLQTQFEISQGTETATYLQTIDFYIALAKEFSAVNIQTIGETDSGHPLHLVTYNPEGTFNFQKIGNEKTLILINNGIHPGESDGIDATMLLFRDLVTGKLAAPKNTVVATIPIYNVGGALNRNSTTRANQNGPKSYGFRGNAQNYDLNRDFIKTDTKNARTFAQIFHLVKPDIFIDNHVSNGADYQYTLTHLFTQHDKLGGELGRYVHDSIMPELQNSLANAKWDITPYVNVFNQVPETGFSQFMDSPRYSTGYTTLWNTLGMMVETHMLKPYKQRVEGNYELLVQMLNIAEADGKKIKELRRNSDVASLNQKYYPVHWEVDTTRSSVLDFKGFEADTLVSPVTGFPRLKYDRNRPFIKKVEYRDYFIATDSVAVPEAYLIKHGWHKIIDLLQLNKIDFNILEKDTLMKVQSYRIESYKTRNEAFEGHYPHFDTKVEQNTRQINFNKGDLLVPTNQPGIRYIMETLEPSAVDSFFNWNFFDTILQEKEGFSPYVFEDIAFEMLENDTLLKSNFASKKSVEPEFANNWYAQLQWLFEHSKYYEPEHLQYPIYRIPKTE